LDYAIKNLINQILDIEKYLSFKSNAFNLIIQMWLKPFPLYLFLSSRLKATAIADFKKQKIIMALATFPSLS